MASYEATGTDTVVTTYHIEQAAQGAGACTPRRLPPDAGGARPVADGRVHPDLLRRYRPVECGWCTDLERPPPEGGDVSEIDELRERLAAAERVCVLVGWIPPSDGVKGDAACQAWMDWHHAYGKDAPEITAGVIAGLADRRRAIQDATLKRFVDNRVNR